MKSQRTMPINEWVSVMFLHPFFFTHKHFSMVLNGPKIDREFIPFILSQPVFHVSLMKRIKKETNHSSDFPIVYLCRYEYNAHLCRLDASLCNEAFSCCCL